MSVGRFASDTVTPDADGNKPVIVRVKRKPHHSPLDAFWLEINERPWKRQVFDFENLSISDNRISKNRQEEIGPRKILVTHFDTVSGSKEVIHVVQEFIALKPNESVERATRFAERKLEYKKQSQPTNSSAKSRKNNEIISRNIRFEQIWRSRTKAGVSSTGSLSDVCQFYDVVRVDDEASSSKAHEGFKVEDQKIFSSYLSLLKDHCPSAASELESDLRHCSSSDEFVYDYYALNEGVEISEDTSFELPLVQVEDEEYYCNENDESEADSYDSNAECHPFNEYPDESTEEEDDVDDADDDVDEDIVDVGKYHGGENDSIGSFADDDVDAADDDVDEDSVDEDSVDEGSINGRYHGGGNDSMGPFADSSDEGWLSEHFDTYETEQEDYYD